MSDTATVQVLCSAPDCHEEPRAGGMCNPHYLIWYRDQRNEIEAEVRKALRLHGDPDGYFCDADPDCKEISVRWWVKNGTEHIALCSAHTEQILSDLRRDVRRLELKV